jgi:hypothetical protein
MVSWSGLIDALSRNTLRTFSVANIQVSKDISVEVFKLVIPLPVISTVSSSPVLNPISLEKSKPLFVPDEEDEELPPPPPMPKAVVKTVTTPVIQTESQKPQQIQKKTKEVNPLPRATKTAIDPLLLAITTEDPLYDSAPHNTRAAIERTAATRYEAALNDIYKSEGGRSRGWTKGALESWIKPRVASGGNKKELDRAKVGFSWQLITEDKPHSAFLDFLCVVKQIRVAVWFEETKMVHIYPAADASAAVGSELPLYNVNHTGAVLVGPRDGAELYAVAEKHNYTVLPCLSVLSSLSGLKLDELESVGKGLGMASVEGKKPERVAAIATYKLRQRLL